MRNCHYVAIAAMTNATTAHAIGTATRRCTPGAPNGWRCRDMASENVGGAGCSSMTLSNKALTWRSSLTEHPSQSCSSPCCVSAHGSGRDSQDVGHVHDRAVLPIQQVQHRSPAEAQ